MSPRKITSVNSDDPARPLMASATSSAPGLPSTANRNVVVVASCERLRSSDSAWFEKVHGARCVTQARAEEPDVVDDGVDRRAPADLDDDLVADAIAVLEVDGEAGEVVVDLVLTTDGHGRTEEPGARQEEGGVDVEQMEAGDGDHDPHHERHEVVQHPRRGIDALPAPMLAHLERLATDAP